ncbi:transposase [Paeniglutamicibacter psychrophenolicus]|uniref:transposase n=1 Tax=Paeniglutamicibacter psychrophenolicus TaxID=257454 RepID=UPI00277E3E50|nr:hypothetical protein [Paeniglutamicibacter psychrophenolicus]
MISTVDPVAGHGHKASARGFDGYKGHVAIDPDSEIITATDVTAGNTGDAEPATGLLAEEPAADTDADPELPDDSGDDGPEPLPVYGDAVYGAGALLVELEASGAQVLDKVPPPAVQGGRYPKDRFLIDSDVSTVRCPANITVPIRPGREAAEPPPSAPPARWLRPIPSPSPDGASPSALTKMNWSGVEPPNASRLPRSCRSRVGPRPPPAPPSPCHGQAPRALPEKGEPRPELHPLSGCASPGHQSEAIFRRACPLCIATWSVLSD